MHSFLWGVFLLIACSAAYALDPGTAQGKLQIGPTTIPLTHAYAQLHDNAEGLLSRPKELRILITDREVKQEVLHGLVFLPVEEMAREGKVRGLLLLFDPHDRTHGVVMFLYPPASSGESLLTQTRTDTEGIVKNLQLTPQRVGGTIADLEPDATDAGDVPPITYTTSFSAPVFHEPPVTEDIKGQAAKNAPQIKLLRTAAEALKKADFETLRSLSTARANLQTDALRAQHGVEFSNFARLAGQRMAQFSTQVQRVVVRGNRAVAIFPEHFWRTFELVDGAWKIDD
jgi:hypothetical protein